MVCTGSASGHVALWNLEKRKLQSEIHAAHTAAVTGMKCLPSQPILVTSSPDNALKVSLTTLCYYNLWLSGSHMRWIFNGYTARSHLVDYYTLLWHRHIVSIGFFIALIC